MTSKTVKSSDIFERKLKEVVKKLHEDQYINASINIRSYGLGQTDKRNSAGTVKRTSIFCSIF